MKTRKTMVTILAVIVASIAVASEKNKTAVQSLSEDKVLVSVQLEQASKFELTIANENGDVVYYKQSKSPVDSYQKIFNLKNLENGEYAMTFSMDGQTSESHLVKSNEKISVTNLQNVIPPYFAFDGEKLMLSHLNVEKADYQLDIYGKDGLVYSGRVGEDKPFSSAFNFSKMGNGNYEVVMSSSSDHFTYSFNK